MNPESASLPIEKGEKTLSGELPWSVIMPWVVKLRFTVSAATIVIALGVQHLLRIPLPQGWIFLIAGLMGISNVVFLSRIDHSERGWGFHPSTIVGLLFFFDTICLTVLLMLTGGATNPFTVLYLVYMTLSAATLGPIQTWLFGMFSTLCFGVLFFFYRPIPQLEMAHHGSAASLHLIGMWIGFLVTVFLVATFSGTMSRMLRSWNTSMIEMQQNLAKKERLASLATLAAGAAHELNTPLGTIAILAKELEHQVEKSLGNSEFQQDCRVIRQEVDRCQQILLKLNDSDSSACAKAQQGIPLATLLKDIQSFSQDLGHPIEIEVPKTPNLSSTFLLREPVWQSLTALLKNAIDASSEVAPIRLSVVLQDDRLQFRIADHGIGMPEESLRRIGEPFFTTKEPGKGLGLGTFLATTFAEQLGGRLFYESALRKGTLAVFEIPFPSKR